MPSGRRRAGPATVMVSAEARSHLDAEGIGVSLDDAVERGIFYRVKLNGRWLWTDRSGGVEEAIDRFADAAAAISGRWLLTPLPVVCAATARDLDRPLVTLGAGKLILHEALRQQRLGGLAALNAAYQPYYLVHHTDDTEALATLIDLAKRRLHRDGVALADDLPGPAPAREHQAWRRSLLAHAELLGLGWVDGGKLRAW